MFEVPNIVMAAPDVPTDEFGHLLDGMRQVAKRITLYACGGDWALSISEDWNAFPRAGTGGAQGILVSDKLESIDVDSRWLSTNHSYVFEAGKVLSDLKTLVLTDADAEARGLNKRPKAPSHYWEIP